MKIVAVYKDEDKRYRAVEEDTTIKTDSMFLLDIILELKAASNKQLDLIKVTHFPIKYLIVAKISLKSTTILLPLCSIKLNLFISKCSFNSFTSTVKKFKVTNKRLFKVSV